MKPVARFSSFILLVGIVLFTSVISASGAEMAQEQPTPEPILITVDESSDPTPPPFEPSAGGEIGVAPVNESVSQINAQLLVGAEKVTVAWETAQPTTGWVLYGSDPLQLEQQAPKEVDTADLSTQHKVVLRPPQSDLPLYFAIIIDGVRYDDDGWPFKVYAGDVGGLLDASAEPGELITKPSEYDLLLQSPESPAACPPTSCTPGRNVNRSFFVQVVQRLNDVSYNDFAVAALQAWAPHENTNACWNPLATTWKMNEVCNFNSVGVQHYQNQDMGVRATANTLNLSYYNAIRKMMRHEAFDREALRKALGTWGTCSGSRCDSILNKWKNLYDNHNSETDDGRTISNGQMLTGSINPANDKDTTYFTGSKDQRAVINMYKDISSSLDTYLHLYAPNGQEIAINDDGGSGYNSRIDKKLPQTGRYRIVAHSWAHRSTGAYALKLELKSDSISCPTGQYKAEYFNNRNLSGSPTFTRCESSLLKDWRSGGPGNGVGSDNFSVRWTGQFTFSGGDYTFTTVADDGIRVYLDGQRIIDAWRDQPPTTYRTTRHVSSGTHTIKVEYYENGGGAVAKLWWDRTTTCSNQYKAEYWSNRYLSGSPVMTRCEGWPINHNWNGGGPGGGVPSDNFSVRWTGTANISQGTYKFIARADDGIRVWLDGRLIIDAWRDQAPKTYTTTRSVSSGNHTIKVEYYEHGGGAVAQFYWQRVQTSSGNLALNKPAGATSSESSSYTPRKGNDGSNSTRWSSHISSSLGRQVWYVDLGSHKSFNRVRINWEASYAANYMLIWSSDGRTWYTAGNGGTTYRRSGSGWADHSFGTRSRRYVGVYMLSRAPRMNNYSFYEFEIYGPSGQNTIELQPDIELQDDDLLIGEMNK